MTLTLKTKPIVTLILKTNKYLCDLFEPDEGFRQDEVDQLEALLNSEVCEESDDEEYEEIDTNQRSSKSSKEKFYLNYFELHEPNMLN